MLHITEVLKMLAKKILICFYTTATAYTFVKQPIPHFYYHERCRQIFQPCYFFFTLRVKVYP